MRQSVNGPVRLEQKTSDLPSAVHAWLRMTRASRVRRRASPPESGTVYNSLMPLEGERRKETDLPSGEKAAPVSPMIFAGGAVSRVLRLVAASTR